MNTIIEIAILFCLFLLTFTYFLYPITLMWIHKLSRLLRGTARQKKLNNSDFPSMALLFAAFNEEKVLEEKIQNCLELNYPAEKLRILIGSDGSHDRTPEILQKFQNHSQIQVFIFKENRGKASVINDLVKESHAEILVLCDANTMILPNALLMMKESFADPQVGCVSGRLILQDSGATSLGEGESFYWNMETQIKKIEGELGCLIGSNGALYAIRKNLMKEIPIHKRVMDDFYASIYSLIQGYKNTYQTLAIGVEKTSKSADGEFKRKIRIGEANYNFLFTYFKLLNPFRPLVAYCFLSHKLLKWFAPHLLILVFILSLVGSFEHNWILILLSLQCFLYLLAWKGYRLNIQGKKSSFSKIPFYFYSIHWALLLGFKDSIIQIFYKKSKVSGAWERIAREDE